MYIINPQSYVRIMTMITKQLPPAVCFYEIGYNIFLQTIQIVLQRGFVVWEKQVSETRIEGEYSAAT